MLEPEYDCQDSHNFYLMKEKRDLQRQVDGHKHRAYLLRSEMCRLASWSKTPEDVAVKLIEAVRSDEALFTEIDNGHIVGSRVYPTAIHAESKD